MNNTKVLQFWSDASFGLDGQSATAVYYRSPQRLYKVAMYLGSGSSTEAELLGGILGCCLMSVVADRDKQREVVWHSDCKTVIAKAQRLKSEGQLLEKVEQEPFWGAWQYVQSLQACHAVYLLPKERGVEHQGCDRASRWVRSKAERLLTEQGEGPIGRIANRTPELAWQLIDGRSSFDAIRQGAIVEGVDEIAQRVSLLFESS